MQNIQCADCGCYLEDCKDSISPQTCPNFSWKNAVAGIIYINGVGFIGDISNSSIAIQLVAWIAVGSGIFVLLIMKETRKGTTFR